MSGTEEVPGTRPTDQPKKETWPKRIWNLITYCFPMVIYLIIGLIILKVGDY